MNRQLPLKGYYEAQGKLVTVEGQEELADTSRLTLAAVKALIERNFKVFAYMIC